MGVKIESSSVSVAMCTYNGAAFIEEQLSSIDKQERKPDELVICDDGSSDDTVRIIKEFAERSDIRVRLTMNPVNLGYTRNFEQALGLCSGDIIFMADQDDVWHPNKVRELLEILDEHPVLCGVTHDGRLVDEFGVWKGTTKREQIVRGYGLTHLSITGALSCIRREALRMILPFPKDIVGHDNWMSYIFACLPSLWAHTDLCVQDIRRHSTNTSEWVVNSFRPIGKIDVLKSQFATKPATDYRDRLEMNRAFSERLTSPDTPLPNVEGQMVKKCLSTLRAEEFVLRERQRISVHPRRLVRWKIALRLFFIGGYKYFNGWRSFARDLVR